MSTQPKPAGELTYSILLTEAERTAMARVLGAFVTKLVNAPLQIDAAGEAPNGGTAQARSVLAPAKQDPPVARPAAAPPPVAIPVAMETHDRWARDRKGVEQPNPKGCKAVEVHLWKTEQKKNKTAGKPDYMKVTWQNQGEGYSDANCFDAKLFPWLIKQTGHRTTLYLVQSADGKYLNVVGVRA